MKQIWLAVVATAVAIVFAQQPGVGQEIPSQAGTRTFAEYYRTECPETLEIECMRLWGFARSNMRLAQSGTAQVGQELPKGVPVPPTPPLLGKEVIVIESTVLRGQYVTDADREALCLRLEGHSAEEAKTIAEKNLGPRRKC